MPLNITHSKLLGSILAANPELDFTFDNIVLSTPIPTPPELQGRYSGNTLLRITPTTGSKFGGSKVISYNRLDMAAVAAMWGSNWPIGTDIPTMHAALEALYKYRDVILTASDIEDTVIVRDGDSTTGLLKASPNSLAFFGETLATFLPGPVDISYAIPQPLLGEFIIQPFDTMDAAMYINGINGNRFHEYFSKVITNSSAVTLALHLTAITGNLWSATASSGFTLLNSSILSNEVVSGTRCELKVRMGDECYINGVLVISYDTAHINYNPGSPL